MYVKKLIGKTCEKLASLPVIGTLLEPKPKVAVIRLSGVIADTHMRKSGISHARFDKIIEEAFDTYKLEAVALVINSPGGSPAQSELLGKHIRRLADEKDIPIYAFVEDVAASGGYWLACAADTIYAQETSITGSIGVISASFGFEDLIEHYHVKRRVYTSGKDKSFLDPFLSEKPRDVKRLKSIQFDLHERFKDWVRMRRGKRLSGEDKDVFEGQFWLSGKAQELGIIDGIGDMRSIMKEKFGESVKLVEFGPEKGFLSGLISADIAKKTLSTSLPDDFLETLEKQVIYGRYGL